MRCPSCRKEVPETSSVCPSCGEAVGDETVDSSKVRTRTTAGRAEGPGPARERTTRFAPGTVLGGRHRIVTFLGAGGMGEVYRADDLKLGEPVALKFLPPAVSRDEKLRETFLSEVRLARRITHPNVCRVHDVGEADGQTYLSMEFIEGENLSSLLRRIGRLPGPKALQVARELCAGLAAAHEKRVLHRDLKPANVMLDGEGRARITDFGLAVAEGDGGPRETAGTPAYMSPEVMQGAPATVRSDLYALGLVIFELWTGRRPVEATTMAELRRRRLDEEPPRMRTLAGDVEPEVEEVVRRCLAPDPAQRPASAREVAAVLPGGDPLDAAIARGETPSPSMIAAAAETGVLSRRTAWIALGIVLVGLVAVAALAGRTSMARVVPLPKAPEALIDRARDLAAREGAAARRDDGSTFDPDPAALRWLATRSGTGADRRSDLARLRPAAFVFVYRQSPRPMVPMVLYRISADDPPLRVPGEARVRLDPAGRLLELTIVPPPQRASVGPGADWGRLLADAGLPAGSLKPSPTLHTAPFESDERLAWEGAYPEQPDVAIRVEAAALAGRATWFKVFPPWDRGEATDSDSVRGPLSRIGSAFLLLFFVSAPFGGAWLAWRNLKAGRGDRRGALKLMAVACGLYFGAMLLRAHHVGEVALERPHLERLAAWTLYIGFITGVYYLALEPFARRWWPRWLISWSRALEGRWRDPMVGRDVLLGAAAGVGILLVGQVGVLAPGWLGSAELSPLPVTLRAFTEARLVLWVVLFQLWFTVVSMVATLLFLVLLRVLLRRDVLALSTLFVFGAAYGLTEISRGENLGAELAMVLGSTAISLFVLVRLGLLAVAATTFVIQLVVYAPIGLDPEPWFFSKALVVLLVVAGLAVWAFLTSLGGRGAVPDDWASKATDPGRP